jgi:site-specific DNA-methyltransferase (adenine-specific)
VSKPYYEQDGITIYHGDCREVLPSVSVDFVATSPPYNCGMDYGVHEDDMPMPNYFAYVEDAVNAMATALRPGGYLALNVPSWIGSRDEQVFAFDEYKSIASRHVPFEDLIIWAKSPPNGAAWGNYPTSPRIRANHEWVLIHRAPGTGPLGRSDITWADWSRLTQSIWTINPELPFNRVHPATFPVELANRLILLYSPANSLVCDPFMGTGTVLEAAKALGRRAIGIEVNERYCEVAANRLAQGVLFGGAA